MIQKPIRFFDMFSGAGGFRAGLELAGGYDCIGHCEIDKHADRAYRAAFEIKESEVYYEDATKISPNTIPEFDLLCAGFPCTPFSQNGKRKGFLDPGGTLFFEITRILRARRPAYLLLENVPGLLSHDEGRTFAAMLRALCDLRYHIEFQVLDSADFGMPQSRRRVYVIGYLDSGCAGAVLPIRSTDTKTSIQRIKIRQDEREFGGKGALLIKEATKRGYKECFPGDSVDLAFPAQNTRRGRIGRGIAHTIDTNPKQGVVTSDRRIRRLMPRECFRLQGFSEKQIDKILATCTDKHAYRLAGNAATVNVVHALALRLKDAHEAAMAATVPEQRAA